MILGTQWYILFNVIAGATAFPSDLREAAASFRISGWDWWRDVILPGIFPYYVTGAITASGGAWNASIVAEAVSWGSIRLSGGGLGAYIAQMTEAGDYPRIALGIATMSILVVAMNRLLWRPLYAYVDVVFRRPSGEPLPVLQNIDLSLRDGEIVGLLGRSGSGKSTLLRLASGLIRPTGGTVTYKGMPLVGPAEGIAVVFQTFALFPWLTVLENVAAGLDALGLRRDIVQKRAEAAIDVIGLGGFQTAYPRELSGGMRQRVGFARALVTEPAVLLMDEPFSALDVLTAETLRTDLIDLWIGHRIPTKSMLMVTHNVEEAVLMCNRVVVLASNPGHIASEIPILLPHPRNRMDEEFRCIVDEIYSALAARTTVSIGTHGLAQPLPMASVNRMSGLIAMVAGPSFRGEAELARLASSLALEVDDLFPVAEALHMLEFAELEDSTLRLTTAGRIFADGDTDQRKLLFKEHMLRFVPLAAHICRVLGERVDHRAPRVRFEIELEDHLSRHDAKNTIRIATSWGRYAEVFHYDDKTGMLFQNISEVL